ncbi:WecB/TagA/CpsF family glycosyltransferase [Rhodococcus sp. NPDC056960]|uniref:WecB/TagA/CpsF family glycosyltransferase n=1 Tax=Rhodococcus sp. NPDC056960 TaxID=3345982 RepID=UPI0036295560
MSGYSVSDLLHQQSGRCIQSDSQLIELVASSEATRIQTVNLHHLSLCESSTEFERSFLSANFITADGWPVVKALGWMGLKVERVTGASFVEHLTYAPILEDLPLGLLGATTQAGDRWSAMLSDANKRLVFRDHGHHTSWSAKDIVRAAQQAGVRLLLVAVTPPVGDNLAREILAAGYSGVIISVGGAIDMVTGIRPRAPKHVQLLGLEWAHRLISDPRRLFRRYFIECVPVLLKLSPLAAIHYVQRARYKKGSGVRSG